MKKAEISEGDAKKNYEREFFCAMPNSFDKMLDLLYLDATLSHDKAKANNEPPPMLYIAHPWVSFFSKNNSVPPQQYYNKYIDMCIDGFYGADYIQNGFQIYKRFETDTEAICEVLAKRKVKDIEDVFYFIFDASHPENELNQEIYKKIHPLISKENKTLALIMTKTLETLIKTKRH
ncbi:hypothetical protein [uncultured Psychroserpens sp.]|uniref:hypothetical protein n=1 Tax=uncultured Psychroserpens sp. TaxID=255436 RepID=UPI002618344C|nr:hypothetical protein [uncultured Psychroserpens sp.]